MDSPDNGSDCEASSDRNDALVDRRAFIKCSGVALVSSGVAVAGSGTAAASTGGFGTGGYGAGGFGVSDGGSSGSVAPTVESLSVTESSPPNPHANVTVDWTVADGDGDLVRVDITVFDGSSPVAERSATIDGFDAGGSDEFEIKHSADRTLLVDVVVHDASGERDVACALVDT